ncbi:MAG TPA: hypothetical protein VIA62_01070 [Thermoanaerobaculia bacterium]|jgi:hypothetical protein|nr:hypothetical protein [Thermoanaerobaculia bacterium]
MSPLPTPTIAKPAGALRGAKPESKAAYDNLTAAKRNQAFQKVRSRLASPQQLVKIKFSPQTSTGLRRVAAADVLTDPLATSADALAAVALDATDQDSDRLPDKFEKRLANAFTPFYFVSGGDPDVFATFKDQSTLAIATLGQASPPISHYRVTPLGITGGMGYLQIDYLTVWNRDEGLNVSTLCQVLLPALGLSIDGIGSHDFDEERSAVLVGAPVASGTYATDAAAYKAFDYYLAAHEGVLPFDHSRYIQPTSPVPAGQHVKLGLSRSKHSTYPFNPDKFPIFRQEIIDATFAAIDAAYLAGEIDDTTYAALLYAANTVFFECVVERFTDQGGVYVGTRTNVGELAKPLNGCSWINDPRIREKLTPTLWAV